MCTLRNGFLLIEDGHGKTQTRAVDHNDLDLGSNDEANRDGFMMLEVDVGAQRHQIGAENGLDASSAAVSTSCTSMEVERTSTPLLPAFSAVIHSSTRD
jgi:hypothetical protein